ncbi:MAG: hypothetical protein CL933_02015 [Deltaproteobacteria bacterium]|nr:hypothetical protein [Deltaproteobacteria bacterium]
MLDSEFLLRPGQDTANPAGSADLYEQAARQDGIELKGSSVLVFGFGGGYGVALELLHRGASHVFLQDPFAPIRDRRNERLPAERMERFFRRAQGAWLADERWVTLVREPLPEFAKRNPGLVDLVVSSSVFEHVATDRVGDHIAASARLSRVGGLNVHQVDLRDHFFRYPFEMLHYGERTWNRWLNADNNLNRLRLPDFRRMFQQNFSQVHVEPQLVLREEFEMARDRIRPHYLSGDDDVDSVGTVLVCALR